MNCTQKIAKCSEILASPDWLGGAEEHTRAEDELNAILVSLYMEHDAEELHSAVSALVPSYRHTIICDRLEMISAAECMAGMEGDEFDVSEEQMQAMIDSGHAVPLTDAEAKKIIEDSRQ